jgi:hypothetical protein
MTLDRNPSSPSSSRRAELDSSNPPPYNSPSVSTQSQSTFLYKKLGAGEVRLITILPGTGNEPILCSISTHLLDSVAGTYEAVSYTWGSNVGKESIYPDYGSSHLPVTRNCAAALRRLRLPYQTRFLWIDAICICQTDIHERNEQVSLMANIYKAALQVPIYLGESDATSDRAMRYLLRIESREVTYDEQLTSEDHLALQALFHRPWFNRVWVLQEVFVAQNAVVFCGSYAVSWNSIQILRGFDRQGSISLGRWPYVTSIKDRATLVAQAHLFQLLTEARHCQATDPRDKLFALLCMIPDAARHRLQADYNLTLGHVLQKVSMHLARYNGLKFLCAIQGRSQVPGLPSWVPDWTVPAVRAPLYPIIKSTPNFQQFNAGPSWMEGRGPLRLWYDLNDLFIQRFPQKSEDSLVQHLHVIGYFLGKIDLLLETIDLDNMQWMDVLDFCNQVALSVPKRLSLQSTQARITPFSIGSYYFDVIPGNSLLRSMIVDVGHPRRTELYTELQYELVEPSLYDPRIFDPENKSHLLWGGHVKGIMNGRRFFAINDGFVGFAPAEAEIGDSVYILASGPVPYIVRETHCLHVEPTSTSAKRVPTYAFIGESYVAGVMDANGFMSFVGKQERYDDLILC